MPSPVSKRQLWSNPSYRALLVGETVANVGVEVAHLAIPIVAVSYLLATEFEMGMIGAVEGAMFLILSLPVGAWVDRASRRKVMIAANIVRALVLVFIPLLWLNGLLNIPLLVGIFVVFSAAQVFFDMAYMSMVPALVTRTELDEANAFLQTTVETARAAGPGLGGVLTKILAAPLLVLAATFGYLISAWQISRISPDKEVAPPPKSSLRAEMREGINFVFQNTYIRPVVISATASNFFAPIGFTMSAILLLRELQLSELEYGVILTIGAVGGICGALVTPKVVRLLGQGHVIVVTGTLSAFMLFSFPILLWLPQPFVIPIAALSFFLSSLLIVIFNVSQVTMRQRLCPPRLIGRMTASIRMVMWGVAPFGALVSGVLATHFGLNATLWIAALGSMLTCLPLIFSPLYKLRTIPAPPWWQHGN